MKIRIIGGGPAGLFFAYLMGRAGGGHDIRVYERDPEGATYGWGLVFSDIALCLLSREGKTYRPDPVNCCTSLRIAAACVASGTM